MADDNVRHLPSKPKRLTLRFGAPLLAVDTSVKATRLVILDSSDEPRGWAMTKAQLSHFAQTLDRLACEMPDEQ